MSYKHKTTVLTLVAALTAGGAGLLAWCLPGPRTGNADSPSRLAYHLMVGNAYDYDTVYDVDGRTDVAALVTAGAGSLQHAAADKVSWESLTTKARASLCLIPTGGAELTAQLRDLTVTSTVGSRSIDGVPAPGATVTFGITMSEDGQVTALRFQEGETPFVRSLVRSLLSLAQIRLGTAGQRAWDVTEDASGGGYAAHYTVTSVAGDKVRITKIMTTAAPSRPFRGAPVFARAGERRVTGSQLILFDAAAGRLLELTGERRTDIALGGTPIGEERAGLILAFKGSVPLPAASTPVFTPDRAIPASNLTGQDELSRIARDRLAQMVRGSALTDVLASATRSDAKWVRDVQEAETKLEALLTLHPEQSLEVARTLVRVPGDALGFQAVATALTAVGSPDAQAALLQVMSEELKDDARKVMLLVPHLSMTKEPTAEAESFLQQLSTDAVDDMVRDTAELALGTVAHQVLDFDPARASQLVHRLGDALSSTPAEAPRHGVLVMALGNVGATNETPYIEPDLASPQPQVREAAVHALRYVDTDDAKADLARLARQDPDAQVRARAVASLSFTPPAADALAVYRDLLASEHSPAVVKEVAHNLFLMTARDPMALTELKSYERRCAHPDLCPYVRGLVRAAEVGRGS